MLINWTEDKQKHYEFCYKTTSKAPKLLKPIWGVTVFLGVSLYKELVNDLLLGKGTPDLEDVKANFQGVKDSILNKDMRH